MVKKSFVQILNEGHMIMKLLKKVKKCPDLLYLGKWFANFVSADFLSFSNVRSTHQEYFIPRRIIRGLE